MKRNKTILAAVMAAVLAGPHAAHAQDRPRLAERDRVAILGDSITEQKNYSVLMELYLLACQPAAKLEATQFGWGGETTWGFSARMQQDVLWFKPTAATIAYGMNDGGYGAVNAQRLADYRKHTGEIVSQLKAAGARLVVVGGPGVVDRDAFARDSKPAGARAKQYNDTLAVFNEAAREVAKEQNVVFADLHTVMADAMAKFKQRYPDRSFVGGDGVHPDNVGHAVMAYAFLKALGCDGDIGTINVDLGQNAATATAGHKVIGTDGNVVTIESTRYPFQARQDNDPTGVRSAMDFVPFQDELNRFRLVVTGVPAGKKVKLTWTEQVTDAERAGDLLGPVEVSKVFDADALAKGVNLPAEFPTTPFERAFGRLDAAVHAQQDFETPLHKVWLHREKEWSAKLPATAEPFAVVAESAKKLDADLRALSAAVVVPVRHRFRFDVQ